jgi:hypothetical protein
MIKLLPKRKAYFKHLVMLKMRPVDVFQSTVLLVVVPVAMQNPVLAVVHQHPVFISSSPSFLFSVEIQKDENQ